MAKLTILDFFEWAIRQMNASNLSSLMFAYGYVRDDAETVLQAYDENKPGFKAKFKELLFAGLDRPKTAFDLNREQGEMNAYDWIRYATDEANGLTLATGDTATTTTGTTPGKKSFIDYAVEIFGLVVSGSESIFGGKTANSMLAQYQAQTEAERSARQTTTIMIAVVVIVIIIAAAVIMTRKK